MPSWNATPTYAWDVAAGALLITEAGGRCEDLDGGPLNLGIGVANVLGSNGHIHDELAHLIADHRPPVDILSTCVR